MSDVLEPDKSRAGAAAPAADMPQQTGAHLVVRALEAHGVSHVFGIPGAKIDALFDALVDSPIRTIVCRHEQNAAFMAGAVGRLTGKAGVAIATSGPGVSNLVTGLATASSEGDPLLALGGAVPTAEALKRLHQAMDGVSICRPVTKFSASINAPHAVPEVIANALRAAESGRPGAAFVSLPSDILVAPCPFRVIAPPAASGPGPADGGALAEAARLITGAKNPVVLLGSMASRPADTPAIQRFIARNSLPVVGTFQAAGAVGAHLFNNFGGRVGQLANQPADRLLESSDLIVTIGYDTVEYPPADWNGASGRQIVHIDVAPADLDDCYRPAAELTGDISQTLDALTPRIDRPEQSPLSARILRSIVAERQGLEARAHALGGSPIHPLRLVRELQNFLTDDVTLCVDIGSFYLWIARNLYSFRARQILMSNGQQTLGVALPWAIAASLVRPADKVVSISGDGGFLFSAMELETAVRLNANIVHLVLIDGQYNMVAAQQMMKYGRTAAVDLGPVDVVKYAEAFGASGRLVHGPDEIVPALTWALDHPGPAVIGIPMDYSDNGQLFEGGAARNIL